MQDRSGEVVREYQLHERVGTGGFGAVYRAEHRLLEQTRAIKIIHPELLTNQEHLHRFKTEAQTVARLEHPHIVSLYEFWVDQHGAYIVMQWMSQGTLERRMSQRGRMNPSEVLLILSQIAPALSLVHDQQIVHRDLKPPNILFDDANDAHLADFGLAKWLADSAQGNTKDNALGTPAYMAPEQADPSMSGGLTSQADIYSLGVILYEMLVGEHPYGEGNILELMLRHMRDPMPLMRNKIPSIPEALDDVIQHATAKNPMERFADVLALTEAFHQAIGGAGDIFLKKTATLTAPVVFKAAGDLNARIYTKAGSVLENPRRLVGRDETVSNVMTLLQDDGRVLLHGLAGIGKTTIAGRVAATYLEADDNQVIWVELGRQDADALFEAIARALGKYPDIATANGDERIVKMREMLLETDALLVIDNIWNEWAVLPIIRAVPHSMPMLMTSRKAISIDGRMLDVSALTEPDALILLSSHANRDYTSNDQAKQLVAMLGNHPYAIEMAGKRLQVYRHLNPEKLVRDIQTAPHDIVVTGVLGIERQRSVKELLDESIDELTPELRDLMVLMGGLFASRASIDLLARVAETDEDALTDNLAELERNGLLHLSIDEDTQAHYRLHDLTYSYIHTVFKSSQDRVATIVSGVQGFTHDHVQDYDTLQFDLMNILGAARSAFLSGDKTSLIAIMRHLVVDATYLTARGPNKVALELLEAAINAAKHLEDWDAAHYLTAKLGNVYFQITAEYGRAVEVYEESLGYARLMRDLKREALTLSLVATARFQAGQEDVEESYELALVVAEKSDDIRTIAQILEHRAYYVVAQQEPNYQLGIQYSNLAIRTLRQGAIQDETLLASLTIRANCELKLGDAAKALETDLNVHALSLTLNNRMWSAIALKNIGDDYYALGDHNSAVESYTNSLAVCHQIDFTEYILLLKKLISEFSTIKAEME